MAQITASEVFRNRLLADGRRRIRYKCTVEDNDLQEEEFYIGPFHRPGGWDVNGNLSLYCTDLLDNLRNTEVEDVYQLAKTSAEEIESLVDMQALQAEIFARVDSPKYTIKKRLQKKLVYFLMRAADVQFALNIKTVWDDLPADDAAKRARLDLTGPQLTKLLAKVEDFYGTPATAKSGVDIVNATGAFMSERDEWGDV